MDRTNGCSNQTLAHADVVRLLRARQGERTAKEFAKELGISPQYLSDIYVGKHNIGPGVLEKLGLTAELRYRPAETVLKKQKRKGPKA